jgi:hypothetical protein
MDVQHPQTRTESVHGSPDPPLRAAHSEVRPTTLLTREVLKGTRSYRRGLVSWTSLCLVSSMKQCQTYSCPTCPREVNQQELLDERLVHGDSSYDRQRPPGRHALDRCSGCPARSTLSRRLGCRRDRCNESSGDGLVRSDGVLQWWRR